MAYRMRVFYQRKAERRAAQFLRECHLCKRTLGEGDDIFMYKGDTPFCSEECRQEQIDLDEAMERAWHTARAMRAKSKAPLPEEQEERRSTNSRSDRIRVPNGTVAVA